MSNEGQAAGQANHAPYVQQPWRAEHRDHQPYDRVEIYTAPRWKESHLSGDEWRFNAVIKLYKSGVLVHVQTFGDVETAARCLPAIIIGVGRPDGKLDNSEGFGVFDEINSRCDQEGCEAVATHKLTLKRRFTRDGRPYQVRREGEYLMFCDRHKRRGDCGLEDADDNYDISPLA